MKNYSDNLESFKLIISDLEVIFQFIQPSNQNLNTFSHRCYELLLRSCTEFESLMRLMMDIKDPKMHLNIKDFGRFGNKVGLHEPTFVFTRWNPAPLKLTPFSDWRSLPITSPSWYQSYNSVKHNRSINFTNASLNNVLHAIAACAVALTKIKAISPSLPDHDHLPNNEIIMYFRDFPFALEGNSNGWFFENAVG